MRSATSTTGTVTDLTTDLVVNNNKDIQQLSKEESLNRIAMSQGILVSHRLS